MTESDAEWEAHMRSGEPIGENRYVRREYKTPDGKFITYAADAEVPEGSVFIGITENHLREDGKWCGGYVQFKNVPEAAEAQGVANHELLSADPLTIAPSLACRSCPSHGYVRNGIWEGC